jgi:sugar phosphate permease
VSDPPAASAGGTPAPAPPPAQTLRPGAVQATATAFASLFCVVGLALYGLPFYYDFMVRQFGWTRGEVTSGNALSKLVIGPAFGFLAGWLVDRFGPRRLMMAGILMAGIALVGLGRVNTLGAFYFFYMFNALGYVCGGPLPAQVLISRWFDKRAAKPWASRISASVWEAPWCRCFPRRLSNATAGARRSKQLACSW